MSRKKTSYGRREFLGMAGGVAAVNLSGCTDAGGGQQRTKTVTSQSQTETPTEAPTETKTKTKTATGTTHDDHGSHNESHDDHGGHDDGGHHQHGKLPKSPSDHAEVAMTTSEDGGFHFKPHIVWITPGGTVTWTLESGSHSTTAYHPENDKPLRMPEGATAWDSGVLSEQGKTFEHTFQTEGVYDYFCIPHESLGMVSSVVVGHPDPKGQPGLAPPQDSLPKKAREKIAALNEKERKLLSEST